MIDLKAVKEVREKYDELLVNNTLDRRVLDTEYHQCVVKSRKTKKGIEGNITIIKGELAEEKGYLVAIKREIKEQEKDYSGEIDKLEAQRDRLKVAREEEFDRMINHTPV